ncbi:glycoside hydrolase family 5 protein [Aquisphaera insulae]|uniref:glycoside hydrolase family 5 protein n=1 Tax=Aquisphaera insulae TaxID=2712864 RepID=UPI0013ED66D3|nr:cellulase family glycosylhydrolase [Aquisphaera insulae]
MIGSWMMAVSLLGLAGEDGARNTGGNSPVFVRTFEERKPFEGTSPTGPGIRVLAGEGRAGTAGLVIEREPASGSGSAMVSWSLPIEKLRGARVRVEAFARAEGVSPPPKSWNGIKVMLHVRGAGDEWPQAPIDAGSFGWSRVGFTATIPDDSKSADLALGLEQVTGRVVLDDVRISILSPRRTAATPAANATAAEARPGHGRLRGVMIGTKVDADDLTTLARSYGANHVRWQLLWDGFPNGPADTATAEEYDRWLGRELDRLARLLTVCRREGISVLIDVHTPPGGREQGTSVMKMFRKPEHQAHFLRVWDRIAGRFHDDPAVWGYDLVNEPVVGMIPDGVKTWPELALEAAKRIRAIDRGKAIIVEPTPWGSPEGLDDFEPLPGIDGVVYSVHMYQPHHFTHQGVYDNPGRVSYPGVIDGKPWDKAAIRRALEPARRFERDFHVPIYIGEFSVIRWAPGASGRDWLRDVIEVMEEYRWDWAYHAYREWDGWSFEHGPDRNDHTRSPSLTDRGALLKSYFERNPRQPRP